MPGDFFGKRYFANRFFAVRYYQRGNASGGGGGGAGQTRVMVASVGRMMNG